MRSIRPIIQLDLSGNQINRFKQQKKAIDWLRENGHKSASPGTLCMTLQGGRELAYGYLWRYCEPEIIERKRLIQRLHENKKPFSVVQYFEKFIGVQSSSVKKYELIKFEENGSVTFKRMTNADMAYFRSIHQEATLKIDNEDGKVYEFNR